MSLSDEELAAIDQRAKVIPRPAVTAGASLAVGLSQCDVEPLLSEVRELRATLDRVRALASRYSEVSCEWMIDAERFIDPSEPRSFRLQEAQKAEDIADSIRTALEGTEQ